MVLLAADWFDPDVICLTRVKKLKAAVLEWSYNNMYEQIQTGKISMKNPASKILSQVERAKHDPQAFAALYREYAARVYRYIYARVSNHQDAEDLTSQVFEAVLKGLGGFKGRMNFSAWIFTIARNKVVDSYRRRTPQVSLDVADTIPAEYSDPLSSLLDQEELGNLVSLVKTLDEEKQELIHLRFAAGLTYAEISDVIGKSEGAVKMSVHRLLQQLQEELEK